MKRLHSLTQAVPPVLSVLLDLKHILAASELLTASDQSKLNKVVARLDKYMEQLSDPATSEITLASVFEGLSEPLLKKLDLDKARLQQAMTQWQQWSAPIGTISEPHNWQIGAGTSWPVPEELPILLSVSATAGITLRVLNKDAALTQFGIPIGERDVLVNHEVLAQFAINTQSNVRLSGGGLSASSHFARHLEFDTFYQVMADTPFLRFLWQQMSSALIPWQLASVCKHLAQPDITRQARGFRRLTLATSGSFTLEGQLTLGKAWTLQRNVDGQHLGAAVSAGISARKSFTHQGDLTIAVEGTASNTVLLSVSLNEVQLKEQALTIDLNSEITGLDVLADKYIQQIFKKGESVIDLLQEWSRPGDKIIAQLRDEVEENSWYQRLTRIISANEQADASITGLVDDALKEYLDKHVQSLHTDELVLAADALDNLLETFGVELIAVEERTELQQRLSGALANWKRDALEAANTSLSDAGNDLKGYLAPLAHFGQDVDSFIREMDTQLEETIKKALEQYQQFKLTVTHLIQQAANVKIGLQAGSVTSDSRSQSASIQIELLDVTDQTTQAYYAALITGDSKRSARFLSGLEKSGKAKVVVLSRQLQRIRRSNLSLSLTIGELNLSTVKNVNTDLRLSLDAAGDLQLHSKLAISASGTFAAETRQAQFDLIYGLARQALAPSAQGTISLRYSHTDDKLHSVDELSDLLGSLTFTASDVSHVGSMPLPRLCAAQNLAPHLEWYRQHKNSGKFSRSKLALTIPTSETLYRKLMNADSESAYGFATELLFRFSLQPTEHVIFQNILAGYCDKQDTEGEVHEILLMLAQDTAQKFRHRDIKRLIKGSSAWDELDKLPFDNRSRQLRVKSFEHYCRKLKSFYRQARSITGAIEALANVEKAVADFRQRGDTSEQALSQLFGQLDTINQRLEASLENWVGVESSVQVAFDKLFGHAEINHTLVMFYMVLAYITATPEGFVHPIITLTGDDQRGLMRTVS